MARPLLMPLEEGRGGRFQKKCKSRNPMSGNDLSKVGDEGLPKNKLYSIFDQLEMGGVASAGGGRKSRGVFIHRDG
jgi:hypothetical protein